MKKVAAVIIIIAFMAGGIGGCATVPKPETMPQKLVYGYGLVDGMATAVEASYRSGVLGEKETRDAANVLQKTWDMLDLAQDMYYAGKKTDFEATVDTAINMVQALKEFLIERSMSNGDN